VATAAVSTPALLIWTGNVDAGSAEGKVIDWSAARPVGETNVVDFPPVVSVISNPPLTATLVAVMTSFCTPEMAAARTPAAARYHPVPVSLVNETAGAETVPSTPRSAASIPPLPLRSSESVSAVERSPVRVLAHVEATGVPETTGLPEGKEYVPPLLRAMC
jgi:hypothetical protein